MKKLLTLTVLITFLNAIQAQNKNTTSKQASLSVGLGKSEYTTALAFQHLWLLGKNKKLGIGGGIRLTNYFGSNKYYTTAPAKLTSGKTGPSVFFATDITQNIDSVLFTKVQSNALNLSINFNYNIYKNIFIGFDIDAIGFTIGSNKNGTYFGNNGIGNSTMAKPSSFNLLLISDNDLGTLNSEFNVQYKLKNDWSAKIGFQFLFTEYTTNTKIQTTPDGQKNDRFRNKSSAISIGITKQF
jgi:hypothetical protein